MNAVRHRHAAFRPVPFRHAAFRLVPFGRAPLRGLAAGIALITLAACGGQGAGSGAPRDPAGKVTVGALSNGAARQTTLTVPEVAALHARLPQRIRDKGELAIGIGALPAGSPPLSFVGDDQKTLTGAEPDLGRLVAAVLGLRPVLRNSTWENLFVGLDSGRVDAVFSNVTDTEERKRKYEFASYRQDNLGFEVNKASDWNFKGDYRALAGKTVAVDSGTNQERILLGWQRRLSARGETLTVKHYPDGNAVRLALTGGKIDAYFGPNPSIVYHVARAAGAPRPTRAAGTFSGAGATLQGLIAATAKKGSGLAEPLAAAISHLIDTGRYARWLAAWHLSDEAVTTSRINPPGLPLTGP